MLYTSDLCAADVAAWNARRKEFDWEESVWLSRASLFDGDLSGYDLRDARLRYADLRRCDLRNADLRNADLEGADLRGALLSGALLEGADLEDARLEGAEIEGAEGIDVKGAILREPTLAEKRRRALEPFSDLGFCVICVAVILGPWVPFFYKLFTDARSVDSEAGVIGILLALIWIGFFATRTGEEDAFRSTNGVRDAAKRITRFKIFLKLVRDVTLGVIIFRGFVPVVWGLMKSAALAVSEALGSGLVPAAVALVLVVAAGFAFLVPDEAQPSGESGS